MDTPIQSSAMLTTPPAAKKGRGCFFYGCLTVLILLVVGAIALFFGARYVINQTVTTYTVTEPLQLPQEALTQSDYLEVRERLVEFAKAVESGSGPGRLQLSARDLNSIVMYDPQWKELKGKIHFAFSGDTVGGEMNFPLEAMGFPGRYVTGTARFGLKLANGVLNASIDKLEINGKDLPPQLMEALKNENFAAELVRDQKSASIIQNLESVEVKNGVVTITRKGTNQSQEDVSVNAASTPSSIEKGADSDSEEEEEDEGVPEE